MEGVEGIRVRKKEDCPTSTREGVKSNLMRGAAWAPLACLLRGRAVKMRERCGNNQQQNVIVAFHKKARQTELDGHSFSKVSMQRM